MPAFTPIVLADGKVAPVNHTFDLRGLSNGRLRATNRSAATIETEEVLVVEVKQGSSKSPGKVRITLGAPKPFTAATGEVTVGYVNSFVGEFNFSVKSSEADRKDLRALVYNALGNAKVIEAINEIEPFHG